MESDLSHFFVVDLPKEITEKDLQLFFDQSKIFINIPTFIKHIIT
jgi:hypothetical protein